MAKRLLLISIEYESEGEEEKLFSSALSYPYKIEYSSMQYYEQCSSFDKLTFKNMEEYETLMELLSDAIFTTNENEVLSLEEENDLINKCAYGFHESYTIYVVYETRKKSLKIYRKKFYGSMLDNKQYRLIKIINSLPWKLSITGIKAK